MSSKVYFSSEIEDNVIGTDLESEINEDDYHFVNEFADDSLKYYLKEISKHKLLSAADEIELSKKALNRDEKAIEKLINSNLRLVVKVAKRFVCPEYPLIDLIQDGNMGLIKAAKKFDYKKNVRFCSYAIWWIKQTMQRHLNMRKRIIRIPHRKQEKIRLMKAVVDRFYQDYNRYPTIGELSDQIGITREELDKMIILSKGIISMDNEIGEDDFSVKSFIGDDKYIPENILLDNDLKNITNQILKTLSPRDRKILTNRFGLMGGGVKTFKSIGDFLGMTPEAIRQIQIKVLKKIKNDFCDVHEYLI